MLGQHHHIAAKQSVFHTLAHRAMVVSSTQDQHDKELLTYKVSITTVPIPRLGPQPMASKVHQPQPIKQQQQPQQQQPIRQQQQQKEHHHSCAIHARNKGEV